MKNIRWFVIPSLLAVAGIAVGYDIHKKDYAFQVPKGKWIALRVTFNSEWENNVVFWRSAGPTAIAQINSHFDTFEQANHNQPVPNAGHRTINWGPWKDSNPNVPMDAFLLSAHKKGAPTGNLPWENTNHPVQVTPVAGGGAIVKWDDDHSGPESVIVEMNISSTTSEAAKLFDKPAPH